MSLNGIDIPNDEEQKAAEQGVITQVQSDSNKHFNDVEIPKIAQNWLDRQTIPARANDIQNSFDANRTKAIAARPVLPKEPVVVKKTIWQKIFGE